MGLNEILSGRRSIRRYKAGTEVDPALIREMLEAAVWAPSWKNSQTSRSVSYTHLTLPMICSV